MIPPLTLDPISDKKKGFSTLTKLNEIIWRHQIVLLERRKNTLQEYRVENDGVTIRALYRLERYCCPIVAWFNAVTGERLD